jgi:transcriptional regulator with XRE-family HTH domain
MDGPTPFAARLRTLRRARGMTQQQAAEAVGIKRTALGAYEEGRAEPRLDVLAGLARLYGVGLDALVSGAGDDVARLRGTDLRVLAVAVGPDRKERVALVPVPAAAGYLTGYGDPAYIGELPAFDLPLPELPADRTYRMFQIQGESMDPVPDGAYVVGSYVEDWERAGGLRPYVVVTREHGIVLKRMENRLDTHGDWLLHSDHPAYAAYPVRPEEVVEVWRGVGVLTLEWPGEGGLVRRLASELEALRARRSEE